MSRTLKPIAPIRDPQMDKMVRDLYARVGRLEPLVESQGKQITQVSQAEQQLASNRAVLWDVLSQGTPTPKPGDAVFFSPTTGVIYKADPYYRNSIVGVLDGSGRVVSQGYARNLSGITVGADYYLVIPPVSILSPATTYSGTRGFRYDSSNYAISQSFPMPANGVVTMISLPLGVTGTPTDDLYMEIRADDGSGKPGTLISTSDVVPNFLIGGLEVWFIFSSAPYLLSGVTYHLTLQSTSFATSISNYFGLDIGTGYTGGQLCLSDSSGVWTAQATEDIFGLTIYYRAIDAVTTTNISTIHPWDQQVAPFVQDMHKFPIWKIGKGATPTSLFVSPRLRQSQVLLRDYGTTYTITNTSPLLIGATKFHGVGLEKVLTFCYLKSTSSDSISHAMWCNGIQGLSGIRNSNAYIVSYSYLTISASGDGTAGVVAALSALGTGYIRGISAFGV